MCLFLDLVRVHGPGEGDHPQRQAGDDGGIRTKETGSSHQRIHQ